MKMNYPLKNNRKNNSVRNSIIIILLIVGLVWIFYFFSPNFFIQSFYKIGEPIGNGGDFLKSNLASVEAFFTDKTRLFVENQLLTDKLNQANTQLSVLENLKKENEDLKKLVGRTSSEKFVVAAVLSHPNHTLYDTLIIDAGELDGIKKDDPVLVDDFIIGKIAETYARYSKVVLLSTSGESMAVKVGENAMDAEAHGRGAGNFYIQLPKDVPVKVGDSVRAAGLFGNFFGVVGDIEQTETSSFQFILFTLPINPNVIDMVRVQIAGTQVGKLPN